MAARLAAASNVSVAVVEAGSFYEFDAGNTSQVPGYGATYLSFNDLNKNYALVDYDLITANQSVSLPKISERWCQKSDIVYAGFERPQNSLWGRKDAGRQVKRAKFLHLSHKLNLAVRLLTISSFIGELPSCI